MSPTYLERTRDIAVESGEVVRDYIEAYWLLDCLISHAGQFDELPDKEGCTVKFHGPHDNIRSTVAIG